MSEKRCCVYDAASPSGHCENKWFALGRCKQHWQALRTLPPSEREQEIRRSAMPVREKWTYQGNESALAEKYGHNDD